MSSILTNNSAMVALQTLKQINMNLAGTQNAISTGKDIASAKDNSAVWAISKVMSSDVQGFEAISDSLSLGESTVAVAQNGAETVTDLLTEIKGKIVNAQEDNVDRAKIQSDIAALRDQISSVVSAAQFNGLNLLTEGAAVSVLSSLDRAADGSVTTSTIDVARQDLATNQAALAADAVYAAGSGTAGAASATLNATQTQNLAIAGVTAGVAYSIGLTGLDADSSTFTPADYTTSADVTGASEMFYVAKEGDTAADVAAGLEAAWDAFAAENSLDTSILDITATPTGLTATSTQTDGNDTIAVRVDTLTSALDENVASGGLADLGLVDVSTEEGANAALESIEGLIQTAIDGAAAFGSARGRIETQSDFISKLSDSLKSGIGALVDADMEAASARLQALQTQQQLAVQALSIANQSPQTILSLFR
ncbi:flagellin [Sulfitobacter aestuariivivens]|uniref:Flagellin n=1 Tax=Sulfitobacter aestuariivivens TaxID=2766981 RepID=A0A927HF55_9RHOB|nr:flagellin [Sulfitobacter aestuariivivens]MBD3665497.1 flagellin [Sulfitobacter aestuariivivens]